jgi:hypothetical protein
MKYMLLIHHGDTRWEQLSEEEQRRIPADYQAIGSAPAARLGGAVEIRPLMEA